MNLDTLNGSISLDKEIILAITIAGVDGIYVTIRS
jgi:hypothetical protein